MPCRNCPQKGKDNFFCEKAKDLLNAYFDKMSGAGAFRVKEEMREIEYSRVNEKELIKAYNFARSNCPPCCSLSSYLGGEQVGVARVKF